VNHSSPKKATSSPVSAGKSKAAEQRALKKLVGKTSGFEVLHAKGFSEDVAADLKAALGSLSRPAEGCELGEGRSGISVSGLDLRQMIELTLRLRSCRDTLWTVGESRVGAISNFIAAIRAVPWLQLFSPGHKFRVNMNATASKLWHERMLAERAESILSDLGFIKADDAETTTIDLNLKHNKLAVRLALAGEPLGHRGFKTELRSVAPLREDLAAALLSWFGRESHQRLGLKSDFAPKHVHVPFCGSGTLASESFMWLSDAPLTLGPRSFAFERWACSPLSTVSFLRKNLPKRAPKLDNVEVHLNDIVDVQLESAKTNVQNFLKAFEVVASVRLTSSLGDWTASKIQLPAESLLLLNPPWGERLGTRGDVKSLYQAIGEKIALSTRVMGFCICPTAEVADSFVRAMGQPTVSRREVGLGGQPVQVVGFWTGYG
jgi:23S rRNA G2445 N2-methylase RlmL